MAEQQKLQRQYRPYAYRQALSSPSPLPHPKELQEIDAELVATWREIFCPPPSEELLLFTKLSLLDYKEGIIQSKCFISKHFISFILSLPPRKSKETDERFDFPGFENNGTNEYSNVCVCIPLRQIESWSQATKKITPGVSPFVKITAPVKQQTNEKANALHLYSIDTRLHMLFDILDCSYEHFCSVFDGVWRSNFHPNSMPFNLSPLKPIQTTKHSPKSPENCHRNQSQASENSSTSVCDYLQGPPSVPAPLPPVGLPKSITRLSTVNEVANWLIAMQMSQYVAMFHDQEINGEAFARLSENDLEKLGVSKIGHKKILIGAIERINGKIIFL